MKDNQSRSLNLSSRYRLISDSVLFALHLYEFAEFCEELPFMVTETEDNVILDEKESKVGVSESPGFS